MPLHGRRVGYFPGSADLTAPSDRRRFALYAKRRGLGFEIADWGGSYDVVILNQRADIGLWSRLPRGRTRIVYDAVDSYLTAGAGTWKGRLRGAAKFMTGQSRRLQLNYGRAVEEMCRRADAVICSTEEQRTRISAVCGNVHLILDMHAEDVRRTKSHYASSGRLNVVWEGLASSGIPMALLRDILEPLSARRDLALHLVTDLEYYRYANKVRKCRTLDQVRKGFGAFAENVYLYQWNPLALSSVATDCDLALIPIDLRDAFQKGKPENKLLLFWRMGIPAITSATPAYVRAMKACGLRMTCEGVADWHGVLETYMDDQGAREEAGRKGLEFVKSEHSESRTMEKWDRVFESLE